MKSKQNYGAIYSHMSQTSANHYVKLKVLRSKAWSSHSSQYLGVLGQYNTTGLSLAMSYYVG